MIKTKKVIALGAIAALGLAACGSDDDADEPADTGATADETADTAMDTTMDDGTAPADTTMDTTMDDGTAPADTTMDTTMDDGTAPADTTMDTAMDDGTAPAGDSTEVASGDFNVGLTYDIGGRGDQSFNDSAAEGMDRATEEIGVTSSELVPNADGSDRPELLQLQADESDLVIGVGFLFADDVVAAAGDNPDVNFAVIDDAMLDENGDPRCDNCVGLTFAEEQGSFLVGAAAALKSETDSLGFIGGVGGYGLIEKFEAGFVAGAQAVNPDIEVQSQYITQAPDFDGFLAPDRAKEIALSMYADGADIIYHAAGGSGAGLFEAALEQSESSGSKVWGIGVDSDQYNTVDPAVQEYVLTSMLKRVDTAVFGIVNTQAAGEFTAGNTVYDLAAEGVGYATSGGFVDDIADQLEDFRSQIIAGEIEVPTAPEG